jgi:hypothetical protein
VFCRQLPVGFVKILILFNFWKSRNIFDGFYTASVAESAQKATNVVFLKKVVAFLITSAKLPPCNDYPSITE